MIVRKGMQGSDKCGSCNQNLPNQNPMNNSIINPYSDLNNSHDGKHKKKNIDKINNSTVTVQLPDIKSNMIPKTDVIKKEKFKIKETIIKPMHQSKSMKHFDENSERQLNNDINEELEKLVVKPDNLIRVSKKIYDNIDKKSKMNNDK